MNAGKAAAIGATVVIVLLLMLYFAPTLMGEAEAPTGEPEDIGTQLWDARPLELLILSVIMFGAVLGILKLVGGEFRWN